MASSLSETNIELSRNIIPYLDTSNIIATISDYLEFTSQRPSAKRWSWHCGFAVFGSMVRNSLFPPLIGIAVPKTRRAKRCVPWPSFMLCPGTGASGRGDPNV